MAGGNPGKKLPLGRLTGLSDVALKVGYVCGLA